MNSKIIANGILKAIAILIGIALLMFFIYKVQSVIVYILIAVVISLIGRPFVLFLRRHLKFTNTLAVILTMLIMVLFFMGIISMFIPLIQEQGQNLSLLNIDELHINLKAIYKEISDYFNLSPREVEESIEEGLKETDWVTNFDFSAIPNLLNSIASLLGDFSIGFFSVIFISFFFLKDSKLFENSIMMMVPEDKESKVKNSFDKIKNLLSRYFIGLLVQITILFIFYTVILLIFGIENAVVIAFLCALLNLIPYIGPLIGGILMIILTMSSNIGQDFSSVVLPKTIYVFIGFILGQLVDNFFSQPFIFSSSVKSHPLEIFLIIIIGGLLFGVVGMIVAVPAYTAIKVILKEFLSDNKIVRSLTKDL
ncbi:AI-2E family transporter [Abyssalbus ytuae]|uniref:AI-2E family transporter n=1 Tax=Abyssalbus ytuae TaxID=2926907 RepID=A0A9E7D2W7_9FLAO|nr:AI-2E family transporter [Abyssalbus ytuae]UOB17154.1 AI-2E family transporter [Abyssalbus ytuae]